MSSMISASRSPSTLRMPGRSGRNTLISGSFVICQLLCSQKPRFLTTALDEFLIFSAPRAEDSHPGHPAALPIQIDTHPPDPTGTGDAGPIPLTAPSIGYSGTLVKVHVV